MAFTDRQVMEEIQYAVLEPPDAGQTWPSGLWSLAEIARYLTQRQDSLINDVQPYITAANISVTSGTGSYALPAGFMTAISVVFTPTGGTAIELPASDVWEADHGIPTWELTTAKPKIHIFEPTLTVRLAPTPNTNGTLRIQYVTRGTTLDGSGVTMTAQDEFIPGIKYGVLADMFAKVGRAHDPARAEYCRQRYQLSIDVANMMLKGYGA